jgi:hypothetical protein
LFDYWIHIANKRYREGGGEKQGKGGVTWCWTKQLSYYIKDILNILNVMFEKRMFYFFSDIMLHLTHSYYYLKYHTATLKKGGGVSCYSIDNFDLKACPNTLFTVLYYIF